MGERKAWDSNVSGFLRAFYKMITFIKLVKIDKGEVLF